ESLWKRIWQSLWAKSEVGNRAIAVAAIVDDLRRQNVNLLDLQNMQPFATTPSSTVVSQQLRDYSPLTQVAVQPSEPPALDAYRKAAAVLVSFDIGKLKPLPPAQPDETAAVQLMSECSFHTSPERGPRYSLNPEVRRAALARMS